MEIAYISLVISLVMILMCKVINQLLLLKVSQVKQYVYVRSIINLNRCLNKNHLNVAVAYSFVRGMSFLAASLIFLKDKYYINLPILIGLGILPFFFASVTLRKQDDSFKVFLCELSKNYKSTTVSHLIIATVLPVIKCFQIGIKDSVKAAIISLIVCGVLIAAIWIINGGPSRLIKKLSKRLTRKEAIKRKPVFQN